MNKTPLSGPGSGRIRAPNEQEQDPEWVGGWGDWNFAPSADAEFLIEDHPMTQTREARMAWDFLHHPGARAGWAPAILVILRYLLLKVRQ